MSNEIDNRRSREASNCIRAGFLTALICNAGAIGTWLPLLFTVQPGEFIRPMGESVIAFAFALGGLAGVGFSVIGAIKAAGWGRAAAILGILVNLAPFPLAIITLGLISDFVGFHLSP